MMNFMYKKRKSNQKGFTLIELIVVIAIIGILAGMLLPRFGNFTDDAEEARNVNNVKALGNLILIHEARNGTGSVSADTATGTVIVYDGATDVLTFEDAAGVGTITIESVTAVSVDGTALADAGDVVNTSIALTIDGVVYTFTLATGNVTHP